MKNRIEEIFKFSTFISKLKTEKRFKTVENFDGDTVAAHSWRLAVMTFLIADELELKVDVLRAVKLALIHDFPEAVTGDLDAHLLYKNKELKKEKEKNEELAIDEISSILSDLQEKEIKKLWLEYSRLKTNEARYIYTLDKIEGVYTFIEIDGVDHYDNYDLMATYCIRGYKIFPKLKPVLDFVQNRMKEKFDKNGIKWKSEYSSK